MRVRNNVAVWAILALPISTLSANAQDFDNVQISTQQVAPGVYMLMGAGGNLGVSVGEDAVFLIDDQYAPLTDKIVAAIREISDLPIEFVLNTHWHSDHTGGNENLGEAGALIVAHDNVRERMSVEQFMEAFGRTVPASPPGALPIVTFSEAVTFHINGDEIFVFHVANAHTDGDAIVHFRRANTVHMGDTFFNGLYPFIDVSAGGSIDGMIAAADRVLPLIDDETRVIPGHGTLSNKAGLAEFREMLVGVREAMAEQIAMGKSLEEVQAAKPTAAWDEKWGQGFLNPETFTRILYSDLSRKK
ncbi:MAG: MBL fold metallo-hydrolase [Gemmatimonadota bacterium]|nr:MAG: MBL fold metallo-hydrolase [Gemmatimonadota bacterium]